MLESCKSQLVPVLTYGSKTMIWREKESSRVRAVQMDNLRGVLGMRRIDKVPNARIRQLCGMTKVVDKRIDEDGLRWSDHMEKIEHDRIAKRFYVGECAGSRSVGTPRKR